MLDNAVFAYTPESIKERFIPKKFKADKDYRAAVVEATRVAMRAGAVFDAPFMEMVASCNKVRW